MGEVHWLPGIITLLIAAGVGALCVVLLRRTESKTRPSGQQANPGTPNQLALDDLRQRKQQLMRALRDAQDQATGAEVDAVELRKLELSAARVFKALHEAEQAAVLPPSGAPMSEQDQPVPSTDPATASPSPTAGSFAAVKWMAVGAFIPLVAISLYFGVSERKDDMTPMTGGNPGLSGTIPAAPVPEAGQPGGPTQGVPPDLRPEPSPVLDQARARVAARPEDPEAWAALGWALVEAEGWIDVFETSRKLRELAPEHPDGFVLQASVRIAMGQHEAAQQLVTDALSLDPSHIQGLSFQGALAIQRGDRGAAAAAWKRALGIAGPGKGFEELIAMAQSDAAAPALPAQHPPPQSTASASQSGERAQVSGAKDAISGQVSLADGTSFQGSGIVFIIARAKGVSAGPPAAAKRLPVRNFPLAFSISSADAMMGGTLPPEITLSARLDADGNAGTRSAEDLVSTPVDVTTGSKGVQLLLRRSQ